MWQFTLNEIKEDNTMQKKREKYTHEKLYAENLKFQDTLVAIIELMNELFSEQLKIEKY
ncbi:hypothetical protein GYM70_08040 [Lactobacillus panisapium]|uniref:hypothetical protein n=1 Tax=Lactobacillus panisapium TaxID=2012495 RepID=UPI001C698E19|nr:hypothetical protein [Lactobacillus panisapium]QYN55301.1 hypothetical protein GYM70_08040 [Lactobacillus panisapium]